MFTGVEVGRDLGRSIIQLHGQNTGVCVCVSAWGRTRLLKVLSTSVLVLKTKGKKPQKIRTAEPLGNMFHCWTVVPLGKKYFLISSLNLSGFNLSIVSCPLCIYSCKYLFWKFPLHLSGYLNSFRLSGRLFCVCTAVVLLDFINEIFLSRGCSLGCNMIFESWHFLYATCSISTKYIWTNRNMYFWQYCSLKHKAKVWCLMHLH